MNSLLTWGKTMGHPWTYQGPYAVLLCDAGQSVRHHLLTNYFHTILSVVLAQFSGLGFLDGMEGVIRLAEASPWIKVSTHMSLSLHRDCASLHPCTSGRNASQACVGLLCIAEVLFDGIKTESGTSSIS